MALDAAFDHKQKVKHNVTVLHGHHFIERVVLNLSLLAQELLDVGMQVTSRTDLVESLDHDLQTPNH